MSSGLEVVPSISQGFEPVCFEAAQHPLQEPDDKRALLLAQQELALMSNRQRSRLFPADELGIPLSIRISDDFRTSDGRIDAQNYPTDDHHRFAPRKKLLHKDGDLGKVLRYSNLQVVTKWHHARFNAHYEKPLLPVTRVSKFGTILLSIARYLPAEAIDVEGDAPKRRELTLQERQRVWANNEMRPQMVATIRRAIQDYVTKQDLNGVNESMVEEFLTTPSNDKRIELGEQLLRVAAEVAVAPFEKAYVDAWKDGLLPRQDLRPENPQINHNVVDIIQARAVPKKPRLFVVRHVAGKYALKSSISKLQTNLEGRYAA